MGPAPAADHLVEPLPPRRTDLPTLPHHLDREPIIHAFRQYPAEGGTFPSTEAIIKHGLPTFRKVAPRLERPIAELHRLIQEYTMWSGQDPRARQEDARISASLMMAWAPLILAAVSLEEDEQEDPHGRYPQILQVVNERLQLLRRGRFEELWQQAIGMTPRAQPPKARGGKGPGGSRGGGRKRGGRRSDPQQGEGAGGVGPPNPPPPRGAWRRAARAQL